MFESARMKVTNFKIFCKEKMIGSVEKKIIVITFELASKSSYF